MTIKKQHGDYTAIAGVAPCPAGWAIVPARLAGVTVVPFEAFTLPTFADLLGYYPKFDFMVVDGPIGLNDVPTGKYRPCDLAAQRLLGWPRAASVRPVPSRPAVHAKTFDEAREIEPWIGIEDWARTLQYREIDLEIEQHHQRWVYSGVPEMSLSVLNDGKPVTSSPFSKIGVSERIDVLLKRLIGLEPLLLAEPPEGVALFHLINAASLLWTARRIAGKLTVRTLDLPVWDERGLRPDFVR